jgi:uncharacterized peroxidase-related enzyme
MSRLVPVSPENATGEAKQLLEAVKSKLGRVPAMTQVMANSPAVLNAYLQFSGAVSAGALSAKTREQNALAVGEANHCDYCLAAHSTIGKMVGLNAEQIHESRLAKGFDPKSNAVLQLSRDIVDKRGQISDRDIQSARQAGLDDGEIAEVVANVVLNIFTNYFNTVAGTEVDFPAAPRLSAAESNCARRGVYPVSPRQSLFSSSGPGRTVAYAFYHPVTTSVHARNGDCQGSGRRRCVEQP